MKHPKQIFLEFQKVPKDLMAHYFPWDGGQNVEYIRADLAELTIYDIDKIHGLLLEGLNYEEVLRRFNEERNKK